MSGVGDFSFAFSTDRNQAGGSYAKDGNPKAATFVGTAISKWITTSATTLYYTFAGATEMDADLSKWSVGKVTSLQHTFSVARKYTGVGLDSWDVSKVNDMGNVFQFNDAFTSCIKRKIAVAWKSSVVFVATEYDTDWAGDTCVRERDGVRTVGCDGVRWGAM